MSDGLNPHNPTEMDQILRQLPKHKETDGSTRNPIGFVEAVVRFPVFEGDKLGATGDWFEYLEPGIGVNARGEHFLGTCRRVCKVIMSAEYHRGNDEPLVLEPEKEQDAPVHHTD